MLFKLLSGSAVMIYVICNVFAYGYCMFSHSQDAEDSLDDAFSR